MTRSPQAYNYDVATTPQLAHDLIQIDLSPRVPARKPEWLKARAPGGETYHALKKLARDLNLHTVCESAHCPNIGECWNQKAATFMMLGNLCTRRCGFCAVPKGKPEPIDHDEPRRVAYAVAQLGLAHAVVTSVNRDDDNLGAAAAFVSMSSAKSARNPPALASRSSRPTSRATSRPCAQRRPGPPRNPQPQHRDRPAPLPHRQIRRPLPALPALPRAGQTDRRPTRPHAGHQDRHHRRPRRRDARAARGLPRPRRPPRSTFSPSANTCAPPATTSS